MQEHSVNGDQNSTKAQKAPLIKRTADAEQAVDVGVPPAEPNRKWAKFKHYFNRGKDLIWVAGGGWLVTGGPTFIAKFKFGRLITPPEIIVNGVAMGAAAILLVGENIYSVRRNSEFAKLQNDLHTMLGRREELERVHAHLTVNIKDLLHYHTLKKSAHALFSLDPNNSNNGKKGKAHRTLQYIHQLAGDRRDIMEYYLAIRNNARLLKRDLRELPMTVNNAKIIVHEMELYHAAVEREYYLMKGSMFKYVADTAVTASAISVAEFSFIIFWMMTPNALFAADSNFVTWMPLVITVMAVAGAAGVAKLIEVIMSKVNGYRNDLETLRQVNEGIRKTTTLIDKCDDLSRQCNEMVHFVTPGTSHARVKSSYQANNDLQVQTWKRNRNGIHVDSEYDPYTGSSGTNIYSARVNVVRASDVATTTTYPTDQQEGDDFDAGEEGYQLRTSNRSGRGLF